MKIENKNINNDKSLTQEQIRLINELINFNKNAYSMDVFEDWNLCKNNTPQFTEFFEETEKEAIKELIEAQQIATVLNHPLTSYLSIPEPLVNNFLISYFGIQSIYNRHVEVENNKFYQYLSIDNVGIFRATLMINIIALLYHYIDNSVPIGLKIHFERTEFELIIGPIIKYYCPKIMPSIDEIQFI